MPKITKPRPKNIRETLDEQLGGDVQDPASISRFFDHDGNRGTDVSTKGDRIKDISIGLMDIDNAIIKYIEQEVKPSIIQDGQRIKVPIMYGFPERWNTIQEKGYLREFSGRFIAPVIVIKRDSIENNRTLGTKIDPNVPANLHVFETTYTKKNQYDNFTALTNRIPVKEYRLVVMPEYLTLQYSAVIFTNHLEQNNKIIEALQYEENSYWGEQGRFLFRVRINSFNTSTEYSLGEDRTTRTNFDITLNGYIIPDTVNKEISYPIKFVSKAQVVFNLETDDVNDIFTTTGKSKSTTKTRAVNFPTPPQSGGGGGSSVDTATLVYLNTNKQLTGTVTNTTTVTFSSTWLTAPSTLPATSIDSFSFFCNGQFIEKTAIVSFTESSGISTLVIDVTQLGFSLSSIDEVIAIGKFA
jgi:hypothetical protein